MKILMDRNFNGSDLPAYIAEGICKRFQLVLSEMRRFAVYCSPVQPLGEPAAGLVEIVLGNVCEIEHRHNRLDCCSYAEVSCSCNSIFCSLEERLTELFRRLFGELADLSVNFRLPRFVCASEVFASEIVEFFFCSHISWFFKSSPFGEVLKVNLSVFRALSSILRLCHLNLSVLISEFRSGLGKIRCHRKVPFAHPFYSFISYTSLPFC